MKKPIKKKIILKVEEGKKKVQQLQRKTVPFEQMEYLQKLQKHN